MIASQLSIVQCFNMVILLKLEFQGPTGPPILAPAVGWLATLTFGLASLNLSKLRWGRTYE